MTQLLLAVLVIVVLLRLVENLLDLALIELTRWVSRRRIPLKMRQFRLELEIQRAAIPDQVRKACAESGCLHGEDHILEQLATFDQLLLGRLEHIEKSFHEQIQGLKPSSAWQFFAVLGKPDLRVVQLTNLAHLILRH